MKISTQSIGLFNKLNDIADKTKTASHQFRQFCCQSYTSAANYCSTCIKIFIASTPVQLRKVRLALDKGIMNIRTSITAPSSSGCGISDNTSLDNDRYKWGKICPSDTEIREMIERDLGPIMTK